MKAKETLNEILAFYADNHLIKMSVQDTIKTAKHHIKALKKSAEALDIKKDAFTISTINRAIFNIEVLVENAERIMK